MKKADFVISKRLRVRGMHASRARLEDLAAARAKELSTLNAIAETLSQSLDLSKTLDSALEKALMVLEIDGGGIYLLDEKSEVLKIAAQRGFSPELVEKIDSLRVGEGFSGEVVVTGKPLVVKDMDEDPRLTRMAVVEAGIHSVAVVPLTSKGKVPGTLFVVTRGSREFNQQEIELLTSIGRQIGMAIENARLYEETKRKLAQLTALQETTRAVVSTLELDALLNLIIQQATSLLQAEGGILNLAHWDTGEDEVVACAGKTKDFMGMRYSLEKSLSGWATLHNQPVILNQLWDDPRVIHEVNEIYKTQMKNIVVAPLNVKGKVSGTLVVVNKLGGEKDFTQDDLDLLVPFANQAATAIENARLYTSERRRAEQFRVIGEIGQRIASALDVDELLEQIARLIQSSFGYQHVGIGMVDGDYVVSKAEVGAYEDAYHAFRIKIGEGSWGWVAQHGLIHLCPDVRKDPHFHIDPGTENVRSHLCIPLKTKDEVIGVLSVGSSRVNAFDDSDVILLQSLAHQAAVAVENIRYYERAQRTAVMEERSRLARELHDAVTQTIFSASLLAEALPEIWENDPQEGQRVVQELRGLSRGALAEMRTLLLELRPSALAEIRLEDLLRQLGEAASGREGIPVQVTIEGQGILPPEVHIAFYRITQEALNNIVKHARASQAIISLCYSCTEKNDPGQTTGTSVLLIIRDDGCGFDPVQVLPHQLGLGIMQERAGAIGASLTLDSQPGEGTQVTVLWEQGAE